MSKKPTQQELLDEFERMLNETDVDSTDMPLWLNERERVPMVKLCKHPKKYPNVISKALKFWYCPDCKKDLGDVKDDT